ncbi:MAG: septum formation initiator family protein [Lachnospiraceae bacterium]|nr:septum formation initiator family protein [Lachnospiraceae bacterium]
MSRRISFRTKRRQNKLGMTLVSVVVLMLLIVVSISSVDLKKKQAVYLEKQAFLEEQIAQEQQRAEEIDELKKYTQTKAYIEEVAKDKLGLVHSDEIVFQMDK